MFANSNQGLEQEAGCVGQEGVVGTWAKMEEAV